MLVDQDIVWLSKQLKKTLYELCKLCKLHDSFIAYFHSFPMKYGWGRCYIGMSVAVAQQMSYYFCFGCVWMWLAQILHTLSVVYLHTPCITINCSIVTVAKSVSMFKTIYYSSPLFLEDCFILTWWLAFECHWYAQSAGVT